MEFGQGDKPSRYGFKTKADVVEFVKEAVADGANAIQQQGDAGLDKTLPWGNKMVHGSYLWMFAIEHSGEHYGQLVVYYRANNLVPPDSRRDQAQQAQQPPPTKAPTADRENTPIRKEIVDPAEAMPQNKLHLF